MWFFPVNRVVKRRSYVECTCTKTQPDGKWLHYDAMHRIHRFIWVNSTFSSMWLSFHDLLFSFGNVIGLALTKKNVWNTRWLNINYATISGLCTFQIDFIHTSERYICLTIFSTSATVWSRNKNRNFSITAISHHFQLTNKFGVINSKWMGS